MHWVAALVYLYVLATGLAFYSPHLYWIATVLGGPSTSRFWHPLIGVLFAGTLFWMLAEWRRDMRITAVDRKWEKAIDDYIRNLDEELPPIDRFNIGRSIFSGSCCGRASCC